MANHVVHFEIIGTNAPALRDFYEQAFEWKLNPVGGPADYALVEGAGIGGGIGSCPEDASSCPGGGTGHVTFYVSVEDIDAALRKVETLGAKKVAGPWPVPTGGVIAMFEDPQGQLVGLVQS